MDKAMQVLSPLAKYVMTVDMFPVFFFAHIAIGNIMVREDSKHLGPKFPQKHPFTSWFSTFITVFSGMFVANFLFGEPLLQILQENYLIGYFTIIWYVINYSPFDVVYKLVKHPVVFVPMSILQECLRARFLYIGMETAAKLYPNAPLIILMGGVIKGNGYGFIKIVERLIRGHWSPKTNEFMQLSYFTKSGMIASVLFLVHRYKLISIPIEILYLAVVVGFIVGRLFVALGGVTDPLNVIGAPISRLFFGSWEDEESKDSHEKAEGNNQKDRSKMKNGNNRKTTDKKNN